MIFALFEFLRTLAKVVDPIFFHIHIDDAIAVSKQDHVVEDVDHFVGRSVNQTIFKNAVKTLAIVNQSLALSCLRATGLSWCTLHDRYDLV